MRHETEGLPGQARPVDMRVLSGANEVSAGEGGETMSYRNIRGTLTPVCDFCDSDSSGTYIVGNNDATVHICLDCMVKAFELVKEHHENTCKGDCNE